ncbi:Tetratricopeptide-like helical protein [Rutstroemia sp. NJR-2017a BVV2]|nr:Tetratricopeptide-like helical protein [Rutstroemia sp. NJR-2017a BVV2]
MEDLNTAIHQYLEFVRLTPDNHPERAYRLHNLGLGYRDRYLSRGTEADLDTAVQQLRESIKLTPDNDPERADRLQDLGIGYYNSLIDT